MVEFIIKKEEQILKVIEELIKLSIAFHVEPLPFEQWSIEVKKEHTQRVAKITGA